MVPALPAACGMNSYDPCGSMPQCPNSCGILMVYIIKLVCQACGT